MGLYHNRPTARPASHGRSVANAQIATIASSNAKGTFWPNTTEAVVGAQAKAARIASSGVSP